MIDPTPEEIEAQWRKVQEAMRKAEEDCDIHITVNGVVTPLRECDWVLRTPCGCAQGLMSAVDLGDVYPDAESAWHELYDFMGRHPHKRVRDQKIRQMKAQGYTVVPMLRKDAIAAHKNVCTHHNKRPVQDTGSVDTYQDPAPE